MNKLDSQVKEVFGEMSKEVKVPESISQLQEDIHTLAKSKGWYDGPARNPLEAHMLIVSELAEATEEARKGTPPVYSIGFHNSIQVNQVPVSSGQKPEGELIELADAVIRIMDYCGSRGWNLEEAIRMKHEYNKGRSYRHGGKKY